MPNYLYTEILIAFKRLGSTNPNVLSPIAGLSLVLKSQGKFEEAEVLHEQVFKST